MNLKRMSIIFLIFAALILSIGFISAADENVEVLSKENNIDEQVVSQNTKYMVDERNDDYPIYRRVFAEDVI